MPIKIACERCGRQHSLDESLAGRRGRCKACGHSFKIPDVTPEAPVAPRQEAPARPEPALPGASGPGQGVGTVGAAEGRPGRRGWAIGAGLAAVVLVLAFLGPGGRLAAVGLTALAGTALVVAGGVGILVQAFREGLTCGLLYLLLPLYAPYYVITRWRTVRRPFFWSVSGAAVLAGLGGALPLLVPFGGEPGPATAGDVAPSPTPAGRPPAVAANPDAGHDTPGPGASAAQRPDVVGEIRKLEGLKGAVSGLAFTPDGRQAVTAGAGDDRTLRLWDLATGREVRAFAGAASGASRVAVSPDGRLVLAGGDGNAVGVWDFDTGSPRHALPGHTNRVNSLAFAPDSRLAASTSWDGTLRLWDAAEGRPVRTIGGFEGSVNGVAFTPDGRHVVAGGGDHSVRLFDVETGREVRRFEGHRDWVGEVAVSADGRLLATGGGLQDPTVRLWGIATGQALRTIESRPEASWSLALTPDGRRVAVAQGDTVALRDAATGVVSDRLRGHSGQVTCVRVAPDGRRLLSAGQDGTVRLWGLPAPEPGEAVAALVAPAGLPTPAPEPAAPAPGTPSPAPAAAADPGATPKAELLAKAAEARKRLDADPQGEHWDTLQPAFDAALRGAEPALNEVPAGSAENPSGFTRVDLNRDGLGFDGLRFRAPKDGPRLDMKWEFVMPAVDNDRGRAMKAWYILAMTGDIAGFTGYTLDRAETVEGVDLPRKYHVVQGLWGGQILPGHEYLIWFTFEDGSGPVPTYVKIDLVPPHPDVQARIRASEAALKRTFELPQGANGLAASPDGRRVLMAAGSTVYGGDVGTGALRKLWEGPPGNVLTVAFAPDGTLAAAGCGDGKILLVDLRSGETLRTAEGHGGAVRCVAFLPDGKGFASGSEDRSARLWEAATGKEVRKFEGHTDQVLCLAVSPDGRRLATGPSVGDKVARVWDVAAGTLVARLEGNAEAVYALAFSPDGRLVVTGGEDTSLRVFDAATGRPVRRTRPDAGAKPHALAFLADGRRFAAGAEASNVTFWSVATGRLLGAFEGPMGGNHALAPAPGDRLLSAGADRLVRLWAAPAPDAMPDVPLPTAADLRVLRALADDLGAKTPDELDALTGLDLNGKTDDAALAHVARLPNLQTLSITSAPRFRGAGLARLKALRQLRRLDLSGSGVGDSGLAQLPPLANLQALDLNGTRVTGAGLATLRRLPSLSELDLQGTAVGDDALPALADLPNLRTLNLSGANIDDRGLALVARGFKALRSLTVDGTRVSGPAVERLRKARPGLEVDD